MQVLKKSSLKVILFLFFSTTIGAQEFYFAGAGAALELDNNLIGANARLFYGINETFCFGPEISFFPYQDTEDGYEENIIDLNINAHYIYEVSHKLGIYPLSGINYTIEKMRLIEDNNESETENEFGINYGFGLHYIVNNFYVFAEFKGVVGQLSGEFITAGAVFYLDKPNKKSKEEH
ncbi:outer membrane beta-barrel protein [Winogradskyella immobilis]|uniref:Outer membrane beta-barrel protein n=1 Tax=Winogradskyella immobilis TaxID=2816852 RepID=A0ABS8ELW0_9FLAO|nr:outer membrane beta-barrel protein [Winogradskyella immobilis]MCC1483832.1 outer membrane beta-barrel protein [Winogradskyella immobilis]MCG0015926.1 outer membrane beta-barrel protein [Winogradskyella immobilis]